MSKTPRKIKPKQVGGKTKFRPEYVTQVRTLIRLGKNISECVSFFGITKPTWGYWKRRYPEFREAIEESLEEKVHKVEDALFKRAIGYEATETVVEEIQTDKGSRIVKRKTKKQIAGDVTAQKFFLTNRNPSQWSDKAETKHVGHDGNDLKWQIEVIDAKSQNKS